MKKINLVYWNEDNFGDALSPELISELTGANVQYKNLALSRRDRIQALLTLDAEKMNLSLYPWQHVLGCIGSILSWLPKGATVWGTGFMKKGQIFRGGKVYAVRGPLTDNQLVAQGLPACNVFGDPALLLPLWIKQNALKTHKVGIIPHWSEVDEFKECYGDRYYIVDLRTRDIMKVVQEITSCEYILSTSLHGIIVAQAYHIPSIWIKKGDIGTDGFKFHDYFSSVNIPIYDGFENIEEILASDVSWQETFYENYDKTLIKANLSDIQKKLLKAFPYKLKSNYRKLIY